MKTPKSFKALVYAVLLFLLVPLLLMIVTAFNSSSAVSFHIKGITLKWFIKALSSKSFMKALKLSFNISIIATIISLFIGIPVAYGLWKYPKKWLKDFFLSSTFIPTMVISYALFNLLILQLKLQLFTSLVIAHLIVTLPYIIRIISASLSQFDQSIEEVSWTLGMNKFTTFITIIIPNIKGGIISSFILAFINSFNNYPISMFLTGPGINTLPIAILDFVEYNYDPTVSAISVLLMAMTLIIMLIVEKTLGLNRLKG